MDISQITEFIITAAPAVTAIIGVVVALIVGIKQIKNTNNETLQDVKKTNREMLAANTELLKENLELKSELKEVICHIKNIKVKNDKGK